MQGGLCINYVNVGIGASHPVLRALPLVSTYHWNVHRIGKASSRLIAAVIEGVDHLQLSERDSLRVLDLLENPPTPNTKLLRVARSLPKRS